MSDKPARPNRELWFISIILFLIAITFPFLHIFNRPLLVFGLPLLLSYLFVAWLLFIAAIYLLFYRNDDVDERPGEQGDS